MERLIACCRFVNGENLAVDADFVDAGLEIPTGAAAGSELLFYLSVVSGIELSYFVGDFEGIFFPGCIYYY